MQLMNFYLDGYKNIHNPRISLVIEIFRRMLRSRWFAKPLFD
jgi:hypothetical protein